MQKLKLTLIALLISSSIFSQNIDSLKKSYKRMMLNVEIVSTAGNKYKGIFISSNKDKTIFYNDLAKKFYSIPNNDIYKLKLTQKQSFGKSFGFNMIGATAISTALIMPMFDGEAIMIPPSFIIGAATTIFGIPASAITSGLTRKKDVIKIEYIIDEKNKIDIVKPILDKNNKSKLIKKDTKIESIISERNEKALEKIRKPSLNRNPLYVNTFHFSAGTSLVLSNVGTQLSSKLVNSDFSNTYYESTYLPYALTYYLSLNVKLKNNISGYAKYNSPSDFKQVSGYTNTDDNLYINNSYSSFSLGAEYVFNPVNKVFIKKYEFGLSAGLSANSYKYGIHYYSDYDNTSSSGDNQIFKSIEKQYNIFSIELGANASYYFSRHLSLKAAVNGSVFMPHKMAKMESFSLNGTAVSTGDLNINIFSVTPTLGVTYSF